MTWPKRDMFAVTVDGVVLVNILALEEDNPPPLALERGIFVGVALSEAERQLVSEHVYDALSELAATISGMRHRRRK
jgi:hypothetical protein